MPDQTKIDGGQTSLAEFLASDDTLDPLHNLAVVDAQLTIALARSLNLQKLVVQEITDHINRVSELNVRLIKYKSTSTTRTDTKPLGESPADAMAILDALKSEKVKDLDTFYAQLNITNGVPQAQPAITQDTVSLWQSSLQTVSESLSNQSQQESLRLQTFTNRYTQASDQATTLLQKSAQSKSTISPNFRN